jgi:serine kinase of HPr protein (carbohydrate metabolism regulator)
MRSCDRMSFLENLEWLGRKKEIDGSIESDTDRLVLSKDLSDFIKLVHLSSIKKDIPVPDTYEFFHGILNESLEEYINRYGLKKTMYLLENS